MAFGQRGLSPTYAIASYTTQTYSGINNYAGINLKSPSRILVFFYEGNDFADELKVLTQNNILFEKVNNPEFLKNYIDKVGKGARQRADKRWHFFRNAHFIDTGTKLAKLVWKNIKGRGQTFFTPEDGLIRGYQLLGKNYRQNWQRYKNSQNKIYVGGQINTYPSETVEPAAFLTIKQIKLVSSIYTAAINYLKEFFPTSEIWTVYVPSPVNAYKFDSKSILLSNRLHQNGKDIRGKPVAIDLSTILRISNLACTGIMESTHKAKVKFIDTRLALRNISSREGYIHGPNDPLHFNERGYRSLAKIINNNLARGTNKPCDMLEPKTRN